MPGFTKRQFHWQVSLPNSKSFHCSICNVQRSLWIVGSVPGTSPFEGLGLTSGTQGDKSSPGQGFYVRTWIMRKKTNFHMFFTDKIQNIIIIYIIMRIIKFRGDNISLNWGSNVIGLLSILTANAHLLGLICNEMLPHWVLQLRDEYCIFVLPNTDISSWAYNFNWTYWLQDIYGSLKFFYRYLSFSISSRCRLITTNWRLGGNPSIAHLNEYWNTEIFFAFALKSKKYCWNCRLNSENMSTANFQGNGDVVPCFTFWYHWKCTWQPDVYMMLVVKTTL